MTHLRLLIFCTSSLYAVVSLKTEDRTKRETTVDSEMSGCHYKGRYFNDGMIVSLPDPCVQCKCYENKLSCKLEICLEYPNLHQDCHKEKDPSKCCAQLVCMNGTDFESSFQNVALSKKPTTINNCEINGTIYKNGDAVPSLNSCQQCYCIHKNIQCITQTCTLPNDLVLGCKPVLEKDSCCPSKYNCNKKKPYEDTKKLGKNDDNIIGCLYENKEYLDGDLIPEESNSCEHCYCFKGEMVCAEQNCSEPLPGCKSIMQSGLCCPVRYECDKDGPLLVFNNKPISQKMDVKNHNLEGCFVEGQFYKHGSPINTNDSCEKCKCDEIGEVSCELLKCQDLPTGIKNCSKALQPECCPIQKCTCTHIAHKEELVAIPQVICEACWSNGTLYHPGDMIKSETSCKICFCTEHGIRCDEQMDCEIPKHVYYSQNCTPIVDAKACCPVDYDCDCVYHGHRFEPGEKIDTGFPCDECYCDEHSRLKCKYKICERPLNASGCSPKYEKDKCCPVDYKCGETGSQIIMNRQSRIDNSQQPFISASDRTSHGDSGQGNPPLQNGRLIIPLGNFENSQANSNFQTLQNSNNRQQSVFPPENNFPANFNNDPSNQSTLTNRFQRPPDQTQNFNQPITDGSATTVHQSFSVDNHPVVPLQPSVNGVAATPFSNFDSSVNIGPRPFMITPVQQFPPSQPMNGFSNQFPTTSNQQFSTFSEDLEVGLSPNVLINGRVIGGPDMVESLIGKSCRERGKLLLTLDPCQYLVCGGTWVRTHPICTTIPEHCTPITAEGFCCPIIRCSDEFTAVDTPNMIRTPPSDSGPGQLISVSANPGQPQIKDGDACNEQSRLESVDVCQTLLCVNKTVLSYIKPCPPTLQGCRLIKNQRSCCPINVNCVSNESNTVKLVATDRQNGQNLPTSNLNNPQAPSSFRPPESNNGPSSFRPQGFEISSFGMAIIPTGDQLSQNAPSINNNQFNMQPVSSGREQSRNRPDNPIRNFQENQSDNHQLQQQNRFLNRPTNEGQVNLNIEDHRGFLFHDSVGDQQRFPINRFHNENNSVPGLMSQTGFRPIFGGIPSIPISQPPENARDKAIQVVEPGPFRKPENTTFHSSASKASVISHNVTEETIELNDSNSTPTRNSKDTLNNTNDSDTHAKHSTSSDIIPMTSTVSTSRPKLSTSHPTNEAYVSTDKSKTTENPPILIPTFPPSIGGRGCRIGSTKFDDGSTVDVGNPCISCSCMDSGLWCVPNAKCAKS